MNKLIFFFILILEATLVCGQGAIQWFEAASLTVEKDQSHSLDCLISNRSLLEGTSTEDTKFQARQFFVYTHPQVRQYLKDEYLMECKAYVNQVGENTFLILQYKINSDKAKINYGNLEKGGKIKVTLMNKDHVYLENIERSRGKVRRTDKYTSYTGTYAINKTNKNTLKKQYIDKITVLWEEGVEEYQVQNVDLVLNQLNYLDKQ